MKWVLMCSPDHYQITYTINPWMKLGSVDPQKAKVQWNNLKEQIESLGVRVSVLQQVDGLADMVFATDQAIIVGKKAIMSSFCYTQRQGETAHYARWFAQHGFTCIRDTDTCFEGGEILAYDSEFFLGTGFRSKEESVQTLQTQLGAHVIPLSLCDARFYHLDTCLFPLDERTVFYYPPAFSQKSRQVLQARVPNLVPLTQEEALGFSANAVGIGSHVLISSGNPTFAEKLRTYGVTPIEIDVSEFIKAGGGIHCLVLPLK